MKQKTDTIKQTVLIHAKPEEVYEAFLDPDKHSAFTGAKATCTSRRGGKFTAWDGYIYGRILELEQGKRIVQEWTTTEWPEEYPPSKVEFIFKRKEGGTALTMVHSDVPASQADSYRQGWIDFYWKPLNEYFKGKSGTR